MCFGLMGSAQSNGVAQDVRQFCFPLLLGLIAVPAAFGQGTLRAKIIQVTDGDTYRALRENGQIVPVRLWGVDAPELGQPYGEAARRLVLRQLSQNQVRIDVLDPDPYGRLVAHVHVGTKELSKILLARGLAWYDDRQAPNAAALKRLERQARVANRCLWTQSNPVPPWTWRERRSTSQETVSPTRDASDGIPLRRPRALDRYRPGARNRSDEEEISCLSSP